MQTLREMLRRGDPAIWFAGSGLGISLIMIGGMIAVILVNGLGFFWPRPLTRLMLSDGDVVLGEIVNREVIPGAVGPPDARPHRIQLKLGNRDITGVDFRWIDESAISRRDTPADAIYVERREYGPFVGMVSAIKEGDRTVASGSDDAWRGLQPLMAKAARDRDTIRRLERDVIGGINHRLERVRLTERRLDLDQARRTGGDQREARAALAADTKALTAEYQRAEMELAAIQEEASRARVTLATANGEEKEVPALDFYRAYRANELSLLGRASVYGSRLWEFVSGDPRESNTEGGIFPAIFGTVMMVILMSIVAVPFGVLAALYLREYARQGGTIDQLFYPELLPTPTFGTGGILWAALTLGLLTVPVVIVASEEALAAVPRSVREASLATGATKFQTILRVVLPAAAPGVLTGLILAMARGAGEVAPLMLTGAVKLAPDLPLDTLFPFAHVERKFMHLGYHIYDVGFQSPNVEAAKPMVYATTLLLLLIVVLLNITAIVVRNRLRRKYQTGAF
jgi:phosphate transport system permease protein